MPTANSQQPESRSELGFSPDPLAQRQKELLATLGQIDPALIKDNQLDIDALKALLGDERIAPDEHYELSWAGKSAARREIQKSTSNTLRPAAQNPERAPHMLIEGENLEVLRVLQKSYYGKVKMIYIDPPYNTGNDSFVYPDDFREARESYQRRIGDMNEDGDLNKQSLWEKNSKDSGRYHSNWLSMMYPRLYLARNLLREDGVIFISIDDNEAANLKLLCDDIFGEDNFLSSMIWRSRTSISDDHKVSNNHNSILVYSRNYSLLKFYGDRINESDYQNRDNDPRGPWKLVPLDANKPGGDTFYPVKNPETGEDFYPPVGRSWSINRIEMSRLMADGRVMFGISGNSAPKRKIFFNERISRGDTKTPSSLILGSGTPSSTNPA
ncbi:MAG: site-specific DNA-methyltransferase [Lautropia sp.]|nr:site-specific DNA-methyltransferase [Lautropia sp.]